jgi:hypothetical protein
MVGWFTVAVIAVSSMAAVNPPDIVVNGSVEYLVVLALKPPQDM